MSIGDFTGSNFNFLELNPVLVLLSLTRDVGGGLMEKFFLFSEDAFCFFPFSFPPPLVFFNHGSSLPNGLSSASISSSSSLSSLVSSSLSSSSSSLSSSPLTSGDSLEPSFPLDSSSLELSTAESLLLGPSELSSLSLENSSSSNVGARFSPLFRFLLLPGNVGSLSNKLQFILASEAVGTGKCLCIRVSITPFAVDTNPVSSPSP